MEAGDGQQREGMLSPEASGILGRSRSRNLNRSTLSGSQGRVEPLVEQNSGEVCQVDIQLNIADEAEEALLSGDAQKAASWALESLALREKYCSHNKHKPWKTTSTTAPDPWAPVTKESESLGDRKKDVFTFKIDPEKAVYYVYDNNQKLIHNELPSFRDYEKDYSRVFEICNSGPMLTLSYTRLKILEYLFSFHILLNSHREDEASGKEDPKDFLNITKVDTHIHCAAAMTAKHLLEFIKEKVTNCGSDVVSYGVDENKNKKPITLSELIQHLDLKITEFSLEALDVRADYNQTFNRFDIFNSKYSPFGLNELRNVFLKTENEMNGRYFAELMKEVMKRQEEAKYCMTEWRLSIYGRKKSEWDELANWIVTHKVYSDTNRWIIQIPRLYTVYKKSGSLKNFGDMLDNIFAPLFEVSANPESHPELHQFLRQVTAFDSVDDESRLEHKIGSGLFNFPLPKDWTSDDNPPYAYYIYYMWANVCTLNKLRIARNLSPFDFRPHSGESGDWDHLVASFLIAGGVNHGINLAKNNCIQYLYYLAQIGIAVSPLSNNALFLDYDRNPFPKFFIRGLNVSLSTDDPLQFHFTSQPLIEEYAIARQQWNLSGTDLSEIAKNSVLQSGFEHYFKEKWLGPNYHASSWTEANDITYTNIPAMRMRIREDNYKKELLFLDQTKNGVVKDRLGRSESARERTTSKYIAAKFSDPLKRHPSSSGILASSVQLKQALDMRQRYSDSRVYSYHSPQCVPTSDTQKTTQEVVSLERGVYQVYLKSRGLCQFDEQEIATVLCRECEVEQTQLNAVQKSFRLCKECHHVLHKHPARRKHTDFHYLNIQGEDSKPLNPNIVSFEQFNTDYQQIIRTLNDQELDALVQGRIYALEHKFAFHRVFNNRREKESLRFSYQDFFTVPKVDTHIHSASVMTSLELLKFIKNKYTNCPDDVVILRSDQEDEEELISQEMFSAEDIAKRGKHIKQITLKQVVDELGITIDNLTTDSLNVSLSKRQTFGRFERFEASHNPFGNSTMRKVFLKKFNHIEGRYFAELLKQELTSLEHNKNCGMAEWRISIYCQFPLEWQRLGCWIVKNNLLSHKSLRWVVQVPRVYHEVYARGQVKSFQEYLEHLFMPLFEITRDPSQCPELDLFLSHVTAFDSVGSEEVKKYEHRVTSDGDDLEEPGKWKSGRNPPYHYYLYWFYANISSLNAYRKAKGYNTFGFRPHSGAAGPVTHLVASFLVADGITHGLNLQKSFVLQYLFYLAQIPIVMSPLGENLLSVDYKSNPFPAFYARGLNVSLSTDNPLQLHVTNEPLLEEMSIAAQIWRLTMVDLCEISRNSVLHSGFPKELKKKWIGKKFWKKGVKGNNIELTNIPNMRIQYRADNLKGEHDFVESLYLEANEEK